MTPEEITLLTSLRDRGSRWDEICLKMFGHSANACRTQWYAETEELGGSIRPLGRKRINSWSVEEVKTLVALYNKTGPRW